MYPEIVLVAGFSIYVDYAAKAIFLQTTNYVNTTSTGIHFKLSFSSKLHVNIVISAL